MKALLLDKKTNTVQVIEMDPNNKRDIKKYLCCEYFDAPLHKIGHHQYRILADDNGWPMGDEEDPDQQISAIASFGSPLIYGNLLFLKQDGEELVGLSEEDIDNIVKHTTVLPNIGRVVII